MSFRCLPRALVLCQLSLSAHSIPYLHPSLPGCCGRLAPCIASQGCFSSAYFPASLGARVINMETGCMVSGTKRPWWDPGCHRNAVIWAVLCLLCELLSDQTRLLLLLSWLGVWFCASQPAMSSWKGSGSNSSLLDPNGCLLWDSSETFRT